MDVRHVVGYIWTKRRVFRQTDLQVDRGRMSLLCLLIVFLETNYLRMCWTKIPRDFLRNLVSFDRVTEASLTATVDFPQMLNISTGCYFFDNRHYAGSFSTNVWLLQLIDRLHRH